MCVRPIRGSPAQLAGVWRRALLVDDRGHEDVTTDVTWVQGASTYVDLRLPAGRPPFAGVRSLRELDRAQVRWIATQQAFAGRLTSHSGRFEWTRRIDLHPPGAHPDAGTLHMESTILVERGCHEDYVEHWQPCQHSNYPIWARELVDTATGVRATMLRVGPTFSWARDRACALAQASLPDLVDAASLNDAQDLVDVEVSLGVVAGDEWTVTASTLPFREGAAFELAFTAPDAVTTRESDGATRRWTVTHAEGEVVA